MSSSASELPELETSLEAAPELQSPPLTTPSSNLSGCSFLQRELGGQPERLTIYCQNDSLLFQFILAEFLTALPEVQGIEEIYSALEAHLSQSPSAGRVEQELSHLTNAVAHLTGGVFEEEQPFPWVSNKGSLGKLKYFCQLYQDLDETSSTIRADLRGSVSRAFHAVLQSRELLLQIRSPVDANRRKVDICNLNRLLNRINNCMGQASALIIPLSVPYKRDENVLYFILRHHCEFNHLFHPHFVQGLFEGIFESGVVEAESFLKEAYTKRGFHAILPAIGHLISNLSTPTS